MVFYLADNVLGEKKRVIAAVKEGFEIESLSPFIKVLDGEIKRTFKYLPYVVIEIGVEKMVSLTEHKAILHYFEDGKVKALSQQIPWGISHIEADKVHLRNGVRGAGVKVGIVDTGIDLKHPDLKVSGGAAFVGASYQDDNGHGTHCAGIVAALDNEQGVIGVAPDAEIYAVKVLDAEGSGYYSDVSAGIDWCIDNKMDIISLSLGGSTDNELIKAAVLKAYQAGIVIVAAAGNEGNPSGNGDSVGYPAKYAEVIAVAATDKSDNRASFSSTGSDVELAAPGVNIYSTYMNSGYETLSGTSMACPHVSGLAALIKSAYPILTNVQIRNKMSETAVDLGSSGRDSWFGYGLISAVAAVQQPDSDTQPPTVILTASANSVANGKMVTLTATAKDNTGIQRVEFYRDNALVSAVSKAPYQYLWKATGQKAGKYAFMAKAYDTSGNFATSNVLIIGHAAKVTVISPANGKLVSGVIKNYTAKFSDPIRGYVYLYIDGALKTRKRFNSTKGPVTLHYNWNTQKLAKGSLHTIKIMARTTEGSVLSQGSIKVKIKS